ncbi:MAG: UDP-N-acetylmuramoyl-L-alanine--D-glutamate ligase [candidate division WOR-3 bacterium]
MSGFWKSWGTLKATVVGGGRAGIAAARLLERLGARVFITDRARLSPGVRGSLGEYEDGGHTLRALSADLLVISPGVPPFNWLIQRARDTRIPTMGELELAWRNISGRVIAVTGTNGKSTTTEMIARMFGVPASGNVGLPLSSLAPGRGVFVVECSSFQLAQSDAFRPSLALILNIDQDHLDWHSDLNDYIRAKKRIFANQTEEDHLILNADDPLVRDAAKEARARTWFFSLKEEADAWLSGRDLLILGERLLSSSELRVVGLHNIANALAAALAARLAGVPSERTREVLREFEGLPHRVQFVRELRGVRFYNDSKGTNPHATLAALSGFERDVILIMGGLDKGVDFSGMREVVRERVKAIIALGACREKLRDTFSDLIEVSLADDMKQAVSLAFRAAKPGDVVLLSPACASFDMYKDYKQRGEDFQSAVREL